METAQGIDGQTYALNCVRSADGTITEYPSIQEALDALAESEATK